jgi:hypothetical protein
MSRQNYYARRRLRKRVDLSPGLATLRGLPASPTRRGCWRQPVSDRSCTSSRNQLFSALFNPTRSMNRMQIICPLFALALVTLVAVMIFLHNQRKDTARIRAQVHAIMPP